MTHFTMTHFDTDPDTADRCRLSYDHLMQRLGAIHMEPASVTSHVIDGVEHVAFENIRGTFAVWKVGPSGRVSLLKRIPGQLE